METTKVTVELPVELLARARESTGTGITGTIRRVSNWSPRGAPRTNCDDCAARSSSRSISRRFGKTASDALDSSALIAYLQGESGGVPDAVEVVLAGHQACLPPVVLTEVTSDPKVGTRVLTLVAGLPLLTVGDGYWARAGELRRRVQSRGHKARLADTVDRAKLPRS